MRQDLNLTVTETEHISAGQPFHLLLISDLAKLANDPDWHPVDLAFEG